METNRFVSSFVNVTLTRQTCGQRSSRAAESKRQAIGNYFSERMIYAYLSPTPGFFARFYLASISLTLRSALFKCEWWSLKRRVMTTYNAYLHMWCTIELSIGIRFNSSVEHVYTTCIFLRCLHRSKYAQQMMDNSWLRWWRVFSIHTACLYVWCRNELGIHVRCCYGV